MRMVRSTVAPAKPPWAEVGVKASEMTHQNTRGTSVMFMAMTMRAKTM